MMWYLGTWKFEHVILNLHRKSNQASSTWDQPQLCVFVASWDLSVQCKVPFQTLI